MTMEFVMLAMSTWPEDLKCGPVIGSPEWNKECAEMTMREEFEQWCQARGLAVKRDSSGTYWASVVEDHWECFQAAYPVAQRAEREAVAAVLEVVQRTSQEYVDREVPRFDGAEDQVIELSAAAAVSRVVGSLAAAIRNRKEQG